MVSILLCTYSPIFPRRLIRGSLDRLEDHIAAGVRVAVDNGELVADAPQDGITLQIAGVMAVTGQMTRHASGFERLHDLLHLVKSRLWH
jgi:hypothetical protein